MKTLFLYCLLSSPLWALSFDRGTTLGVVDSDRLTEISGIVASRHHAGLLWVHNDSGDQPRLYALNTQAKLLATYSVTGAQAQDWEDIAMGPGPKMGLDYLYIGDIGDNRAKRDNVVVYRVAEPNFTLTDTPMSGQTSLAQAQVLTYPDGPHDAEALLVDPNNGDIYLISKRQWRSRVYRAASLSWSQEPKILEFCTECPMGFIVGGDVSPDGRWIVLRTLSQAWVWPHLPNTLIWQSFSGPPQPVTLLPEPQGEAICFAPDGQGLYTISEMVHPPLYFFSKNLPNRVY